MSRFHSSFFSKLKLDSMLKHPLFWATIGVTILLVFVITKLVQPLPTIVYDPNLKTSPSSIVSHWWSFQAIDTMKFSRDLAREKLYDETFTSTIDLQVQQIASTGATHIAIATPYDEEFFPFLKRWVDSARRSNLKVWFRGNWSGWEGWFDYPPISREEHITKSIDFIKTHPDIFQSGDYFTACPECENGLAGDPRKSGDYAEYRRFFIEEYKRLQEVFRSINKNVNTAVLSMNGDVAKAVMDAQTTSQLGGIVTADHYVKSLEKYQADIQTIAQSSNGKVILGEFGAPIPDIHGAMDEEAQAQWIEQVLNGLKFEPDLVGLSYWVNWGGSTQLWNNGPQERRAVAALRKIFLPPTLQVRVVDDEGYVVDGVQIQTKYHTVTTDVNGLAEFPIYPNYLLTVEKPGFESLNVTESEIRDATDEYILIRMQREYTTPFDKFLHNIILRLI